MKLDVKWSNPRKKGAVWVRDWLIPVDVRSSFFEYWKKHSWEIKPKGFSVYKKDNDWYLVETKADEYDFYGNIDRTQPNPDEELKLEELKSVEGLREWQVDAVKKLVASVKKYGAAIDASDLGTGKSYSASGVVKELNVPFLVVCPLAVVNQWDKVIKNHFKLGDKLCGIVNYEQLRTWNKDSKYLSKQINKKTRKSQLTWKLPKDAVIIWDECHKLKNWKTKNSKTCISGFKSGYRMLFLSATAATSPLDLRTIGTCLKMFKGNKEYYAWAYAHGVSKGRFGLEFNNDPVVLKKIHKKLFIDRGVRLKRDLIVNFPECEFISTAYSMSDLETSQINAIYDEMKVELRKLDKLQKSDKANELTIRLRARQATELIKIPLFLELIEEGKEAGMSVVVFVNFSATIDALANRLNTTCIYDGRLSVNEKETNLNRFKSGECKEILINSAAGGAGLNIGDETGEFPRLSLISPDDDARKIRQVTGRIWRENSRSKSIQKFVFVAGTIEERVSDNMNAKLVNLDLINGDDLKL